MSEGSEGTTAVVIGAGMGGLAAAIELAVAGRAVTVLERAAVPGGKVRPVSVAGRDVDGGPTVFTMKWVLEDLLARAGMRLDDYVTLRSADILARHWWDPGTGDRGTDSTGAGAGAPCATVDLFADPARSQAAISAFASPQDGAAFAEFSARASRAFDTLRDPFMCAQQPSPPGLVLRVGLQNLRRMLEIKSFASLWSELARTFSDPRLRQLFGRYATYCGSSPYQAPATLMLVAHVEQAGVWYVDGGMHALARALEEVAKTLGVTFRYGTDVQTINVAGGCVRSVTSAAGEEFKAGEVVFNGDANALARGLLGSATQRAVRPRSARQHALSALATTCVAQAHGHASLTHHNVFFSTDYENEFERIFRRSALPTAPTTYICAQDRADVAGDRSAPTAEHAAERFLLITNAPAHPDLNQQEIAACQAATNALMTRCGLHLTDPATQAPVLATGPQTGHARLTGPREFAALFPGSDGSLYGAASHGWRASFTRPAAATPIAGLALAGGTVHPGPGVPMAVLSGQLAATKLISDRASTRSCHRVVMPGGTATRLATTGSSG
ncbi:MAG: 1-hydroxycarotenoid 3,4-desaturase CrtD [Pseudomonadota bacterium]